MEDISNFNCYFI